MKAVTIMQFHLLCRRAIIGVLLTGATAMAGSSGKSTIESGKAMEQKLGVRIIEVGDLVGRVRPAEQNDHFFGASLVISPDGTAIAWSDGTLIARWLKQGPN